MNSGKLFAVALITAVCSSGCGYKIVRNSDLTTKRIAQDSASITSLQQELSALTLRCRADSTRLANELALQTAAAANAAIQPPVVPPPDSLLKARATEIATLKDQLTKVTTELDRIKRHLANPKP